MQSENVCDKINHTVIMFNCEVYSMKEGIHPNYVDATVRCACGEVIQTRSTKGDFRVEICSKCHPFFTGKQKFVDAGGRVDKFRQRLERKK